MAHTTIGHVEPFQPGTDDWEQYTAKNSRQNNRDVLFQPHNYVCKSTTLGSNYLTELNYTEWVV